MITLGNGVHRISKEPASVGDKYNLYAPVFTEDSVYFVSDDKVVHRYKTNLKEFDHIYPPIQVRAFEDILPEFDE